MTDQVLFIDDLARELKTSRRTIERLRAANRFPIPTLPSIDKRPRWSRADVDRWLANAGGFAAKYQRGPWAKSA